MRRQTLQTTTQDDVRISFDLYAQDGRDGLVLICPGFFQSKETAAFRQLSRDLSTHQDVLCMDFRGHGRSGGLYTFSAKEGSDLEAVLGWARERYSAIHLMGFSLGAAIAINTAARFPEMIQMLVAVSAPSAFEKIEYRFWTPDAVLTGIRTYGPGVGCRPGPLWLKKQRPADSIRKIESTPVLLIHGTRDPIVSHRHSERLFQAAGEPKRLELIEAGGHAEELYRQHPERFHFLIRDWMAGIGNSIGGGIARHG
jgi:pimeloyl-ACP methyl ester carboxylesterase